MEHDTFIEGLQYTDLYVSLVDFRGACEDLGVLYEVQEHIATYGNTPTVEALFGDALRVHGISVSTEGLLGAVWSKIVAGWHKLMEFIKKILGFIKKLVTLDFSDKDPIKTATAELESAIAASQKTAGTENLSSAILTIYDKLMVAKKFKHDKLPAIDAMISVMTSTTEVASKFYATIKTNFNDLKRRAHDTAVDPSNAVPTEFSQALKKFDTIFGGSSDVSILDGGWYHPEKINSIKQAYAEYPWANISGDFEAMLPTIEIIMRSEGDLVDGATSDADIDRARTRIKLHQTLLKQIPAYLQYTMKYFRMKRYVATCLNVATQNLNVAVASSKNPSMLEPTPAIA